MADQQDIDMTDVVEWPEPIAVLLNQSARNKSEKNDFLHNYIGTCGKEEQINKQILNEFHRIYADDKRGPQAPPTSVTPAHTIHQTASEASRQAREADQIKIRALERQLKLTRDENIELKANGQELQKKVDELEDQLATSVAENDNFRAAHWATRSDQVVTNYATDDELKEGYQDLYHCIFDYAAALVRANLRDATKDFTITFKTTKENAWIRRFLPTLDEDSSKATKVLALVCLLSVTVIKFLDSRGPFGEAAKGKLKNYVGVLDDAKRKDWSGYIKLAVMLKNMLSSGDINNFEADLVGLWEGEITTLIRGTLSKATSMSNKQCCTGLLEAISKRAVGLSVKIKFHPAGYDFWPLTEADVGTYPQSFHADLHARVGHAVKVSDRLKIEGFVFPSLRKTREENGNELHPIVILRTKVMVTNEEIVDPDHQDDDESDDEEKMPIGTMRTRTRGGAADE